MFLAYYVGWCSPWWQMGVVLKTYWGQIFISVFNNKFSVLHLISFNNIQLIRIGLFGSWLWSIVGYMRTSVLPIIQRIANNELFTCELIFRQIKIISKWRRVGCLNCHPKCCELRATLWWECAACFSLFGLDYDSCGHMILICIFNLRGFPSLEYFSKR